MKNEIKDYEQVLERLDTIVENKENVRKIEKKEPIGFSTFGYPILHYTIGRGKKHIVIEGDRHGAEIITVDYILSLMQQIAMKKEEMKIDSLEEKVTIHFFPMINPEGYIISTSAVRNLIPRQMDLVEMQQIAKSYYIKYRQDDIDSKKVVQEIENISDEEEKRQAYERMRKGLKYYQEMFKQVDINCISDVHQKLKENIRQIIQQNEVPKGCLPIWSANGNGIDLNQNCEENSEQQKEQGFVTSRYNNIAMNKPGPIGCCTKEGQQFKLEPENQAIENWIGTIQQEKKEKIILYLSFHSTGGEILYKGNPCIGEQEEKRQEKEKNNKTLAQLYADKTGYTIREEEQDVCFDSMIRSKVENHLVIRLSKMGGNPIAPYGDLEGNYYPTIQENIKAFYAVLKELQL